MLLRGVAHLCVVWEGENHTTAHWDCEPVIINQTSYQLKIMKTKSLVMLYTLLGIICYKIFAFFLGKVKLFAGKDVILCKQKSGLRFYFAALAREIAFL